MTDHELRGLLTDVPGSYAAFVDGIMADIREFGTEEAIVRFIVDNPDATAGDVSDYSTQLSGLI